MPVAHGVPGWEDLHHSGLLLDGTRLAALGSEWPLAPLDPYVERELRRRAAALLNDPAGEANRAAPLFVAFVLEQVCGFDAGTGAWRRGSYVPAEQGRRAVTGEVVKPRQLWTGVRGARLPVFFDGGGNLGVGKGRRVTSQVLGWLRAGNEHLALLTNGRQFRLLFAGLDFDASCQWDASLWFQEGELAPQVAALRFLLRPALSTPPKPSAAGAEAQPPPLLQAIRDTRKGQAELSEVLGERVREAVELLIQSHGEALRAHCAEVPPADVYRAACRLAMRLVIVLFAESRDLLPRDNALYHGSYGLHGLFERLEREAVRGGALTEGLSAWPRVLALFRLVHEGSHFPDLPVPAYGGELFAPASRETGLGQALAVFERACFEAAGCCTDRDVYEILKLLTRTTVRIRQGRASTTVAAPVDFSDLSSEYIGIVYEGVLDYELKLAPPGDPVIFLAIGDQPALPLSRLEAMPSAALKRLFESLRMPTATSAEGLPEDAHVGAPNEDPHATPQAPHTDVRQHNRTRAETWARRAAQVVGLVPNKRHPAFEQRLRATAKRLVARVVLPGEWYLVRWGRHAQGFRHLPHPPRPRRAHRAAHAAAAGVRSASRQGRQAEPGCAAGAVDAQAPRRNPGPQGGRSRLRFRHLPAGGVALPHGRAASLAATPPAHRTRGRRRAGSPAARHFKRCTRQRTPRRRAHPLPHRPRRVRAAPESRAAPPCGGALPLRGGFGPAGGGTLPSLPVDRDDGSHTAVRLPRPQGEMRQRSDRRLVRSVRPLSGDGMEEPRRRRPEPQRRRAFAKSARTKALKAFVKEKLTPDLALFLRGPDLFQEDLLQNAAHAHAEALSVLSAMHAMPVHEADARREAYREEFEGSQAWQDLKTAMDLWCACWFWPPKELDCAPLPRQFAHPNAETRAVAKRVAQAHRFFHWELEFPDVFDAADAGFDALLGNPPWDIAKPVSKEFFSNIDPLYRAYGKQEALRKQTDYFADAEVERDWLDYNARFRAQSNFASFAANPFGDPQDNTVSQNRFAVARGRDNAMLHENWRQERARGMAGFADPAHPFKHQGAADLNLYKLFLEAVHALLKPGGRLGFVVPSGLYSDNGTGALRRVFLERCQWEWLFGFENKDGLFPIHRSYKFNPVIVQKGGTTDAIHTAFMRRNLADWERADAIATPYTRAQVAQFSPKSQAILEIQSARDLEILEKIYAGSVLLGDEGPNGWGIRYATEFHMTNDSRLFPPRPQWEAKGYRPDEYSRWLLGDWRPIGELWAEMGVDPSRPVPAGVALEGWLFDRSAGPERRAAEARFVHGHLLKPADVGRTAWRVRCAQPPYDGLPVPRAAIPPGVVLSREGDSWIREDRVRDVALPLYEGRMIGQFDSSQKGWVSGKGAAPSGGTSRGSASRWNRSI